MPDSKELVGPDFDKFYSSYRKKYGNNFRLRDFHRAWNNSPEGKSNKKRIAQWHAQSGLDAYQQGGMAKVFGGTNPYRPGTGRYDKWKEGYLGKSFTSIDTKKDKRGFRDIKESRQQIDELTGKGKLKDIEKYHYDQIKNIELKHFHDPDVIRPPKSWRDLENNKKVADKYDAKEKEHAKKVKRASRLRQRIGEEVSSSKDKIMRALELRSMNKRRVIEALTHTEEKS